MSKNILQNSDYWAKIFLEINQTKDSQMISWGVWHKALQSQILPKVSQNFLHLQENTQISGVQFWFLMIRDSDSCADK